MASEHYDWTVPAPLRALLWWPPVAFVLVLVDPTPPRGDRPGRRGAGRARGAAVGVLARRIARRTTGEQDAGRVPSVMAAATDRVTPLAVEQHAA